MNWNAMMREPCDGIARCPNKVDELGCTDWFYCKNGTDKVFHVKRDKVCNKVDDCEDGSDEGDYHNCSYFSCNDGGSLKYIDNFRVCDGSQDCAKGADECQDECINSVFSDGKSMIKNKGVEFFTWLISFTAVPGNAVVITHILRDVYFKNPNHHRNKALVCMKLLILNLSVSDLIVGIYTFAVVVQNSMQRGRYCLVDQDWRSSQTCSAIGSLLVIGSQQSVFMMIMITIVRFKGVSSTSFDVKLWKFKILIFATWVISVALAVIPLISYFEDVFIDSVWYESNKLFSTVKNIQINNLTNWLVLMHDNNNNNNNNNNNSAGFVSNVGSWETLETLISKLNSNFTVERKFGFYSHHTLCLPTFFPDRKTDTARHYSLMLLSINFVSFVVIFIGCVVIYRVAIRKQRAFAVHLKLTRLIITDFFCWMPVCIMRFLQLSGVDIPNEAYLPPALAVILINSTLNPILYLNVPDHIWIKVKAAYSHIKHYRIIRSCSRALCCAKCLSRNRSEAQSDPPIELKERANVA